MADHKNLSIRVSPEILERFKMAQAQLDTNQTETLEALLQAFYASLQLSKSEQAEVNEAIEVSGISQAEIAKRGILAEARNLKSLAKRKAELAIEDRSLGELVGDKSLRFLGVAYERISKCVEKIMEHNDSQPEQSARLCITESLVQKLIGSNRKPIREFFDNHQLMIDDHNSKYDLKPQHNKNSTGFDTLKAQLKPS